MRKNAEKMDLSSRNRLLRVPAGSHGFWAHDPLPDPSHDPDVDPRRVTIPLAFTTRRPPAYPHRGPIKRPSISYRTGPLGGPTPDKNAYILGQISVKDRSRSL